MKRAGMMMGILVCSAGLVFAQGSLTPPGAPGATMRTLDVDYSGSFIVRNTATGNSTNYSISGTQTIGPIVTATGTITSTNP